MLFLRSRSLAALAVLHGLCFGQAHSAATLHWPDPQLDFLEDTLYSINSIGFLTENCDPRQNTTIAAQWLRLAYHDMSTHDATDGSGGLDASMIYELDRPQNVGIGMQQSLQDFVFFRTPYVGFADMIAMGVVMGVASCGGPIIPFRGGRVDAKVAGPATVPEPQQDLASHIASFNRQGFTQAEMIALVACGHTLGGVRRDDFPLIVDEKAPDGFGDFDGTAASRTSFDNAVVLEYLNGTTTNPLVASANVTARSDLRIFSSDGNSTMHRLASSNDFSETCKALLEQMINTVPKDVKLTDVIDPLENKVGSALLYTKNGSYVLQTNLRRLSVNPNRTVTLFWKERQTQGSLCPSTGCSVSSTRVSLDPPSFLGELRGIQKLSNYKFTTQIPLNASIAKFWFEVDEKDGSAPSIVDNDDGSGFEIDQDTVLFDPSRTTIVSEGFSGVFVIVVGVKDDILNAGGADAPHLTLESFEPGTQDFIAKIETVSLQRDTTHSPADGYTFFTGNISTGATAMHVHATVGGQKFTQYVVANDFMA
ncbi:putative peroxidase family protein [Lyophyllum shimeji]|uniref:Peroxidase n=1 Tax=Lyophyllum shimeji TaxID=47721 RepID=A0A9P3PGK2_LYOSH|nr:putative peroxidase family protein [Lyophyllum shimeji]